MSKESVQPTPSHDIGYLVPSNTYDRLFGKICTLVEALGLPEKQEESIKSLVRGVVNDVSKNWIILDQDLNTLIVNKAWSRETTLGATLGEFQIMDSPINKVIKLADLK